MIRTGRALAAREKVGGLHQRVHPGLSLRLRP